MKLYEINFPGKGHWIFFSQLEYLMSAYSVNWFSRLVFRLDSLISRLKKIEWEKNLISLKQNIYVKRNL